MAEDQIETVKAKIAELQSIHRSLDKMINAMGFQREQIYIANIVKLRCAEWDSMTGRPKDRPPTPEEAARGPPASAQAEARA